MGGEMMRLTFIRRERYPGFVPGVLLLFPQKSCFIIGQTTVLLSRRKRSKKLVSAERRSCENCYQSRAAMERTPHGGGESFDASTEIPHHSINDMDKTPFSVSIDVAKFYDNYFGHPPEDLEQMISTKPSNTPTIYLVGDSSLDNKYWIPFHNEEHPNAHWRACFNNHQNNSGDDEGRISVLKRDICYWLSTLYESNEYIPMNCAVEQTTLRHRVYNNLFRQDEIVRDNLKASDILVVSVGGNDVALAPTPTIGLSVLANVYFNGKYGTSPLKQLFQHDLQAYIESLIVRQKPRLIVICMVYFPCESQDQQSWASPVLRLLSYNSSPQKLQNAMNRVFRDMVQRITIDGSHVTFTALSDALDCKNPAHYVARAEPSEKGGLQIALLLKRAIDDAFQ